MNLQNLTEVRGKRYTVGGKPTEFQSRIDKMVLTAPTVPNPPGAQ
ncbi:hypothetical protein EHYA_02376 [Embleya hyalina]|uniref:Uncharacterized protein n=1 Tax=Embleya hyalina TaxID=516124 RepID=A0A401YJE4_9ACTN|nr:hypothetical protein EHYA_02376 [Embleya hyalina]